MNVEELIRELKLYPSETPVCMNIMEGRGLLVNYVAGLQKNEDLLCVCIGHKPSGGYFDTETIII